MLRFTFTLIAFGFVTHASALWAQHSHTAPGTPTPSSAAPSGPAKADGVAFGEVRKVDLAAGKVTLRHGEIRNLDMAPMTMVFGVAEPAMLERLAIGDKVRFVAERRDGAIVVTRIERMP